MHVDKSAARDELRHRLEAAMHLLQVIKSIEGSGYTKDQNYDTTRPDRPRAVWTCVLVIELRVQDAPDSTINNPQMY